MELLQDTHRGYAEAFGASDCAGVQMKNAILEWLGLYYSREDLLRIPYTLVRKLSRGIFCEYEGPALPHQEAMELAMIAGESYLKPIMGNTVRWRPISRGNILIFGRDLFGNPRDVGLMEKSLLGKFYYTLLERRQLDSQGLVTVTNRLFRSQSREQLGREVSLKSHPAYCQLPQTAVMPQIMDSVGLVRVKMPMCNCVDGSREGVSIYAPAVELIRAISENEAQLRKEFQHGQSRLVVSRDLLDRGQLRDDLFVGLDESPEQVGITIFAPELREQSFLNRQQAYLRAVENMIGLKRGLLSQVEAVDRTATEITSSEGEYMGTLQELQQVWRQAAEECMALEAQLTGKEPIQTPIRFGDGVLNGEKAVL